MAAAVKKEVAAEGTSEDAVVCFRPRGKMKLCGQKENDDLRFSHSFNGYPSFFYFFLSCGIAPL